MTTYRKYQVILSGASGVEYKTVSTPKEAWNWINHNLTDVQQACVVIKPVLRVVPTIFVSRPK